MPQDAMTQSAARCFQKYPDFTRPVKTSVLPRLTNGEAGRRAYDAVMSGDRDAVAKMLAADPRLLSTMVPPRPVGEGPNDGEYGDLLAFAAANCDLPMMQTLIESGMPADGAQPGAALLVALHADEPTMAQYLFQNGASANPEKKQGGLEVAKLSILHGNLGAFMMLIRNALDVNHTDELGQTILHEAVNGDRFAIAELLVKAGANPWLSNNVGFVPARQIYEGMAVERDPDAAAQRHLAESVRKGDLPWPPPSPKEVRAKVISGEWPTPALTKAGLNIPPQAVAHIKAHYNADGSLKN